jgi:uncharacterized lipoprotein YddW (UPF0748 family)
MIMRSFPFLILTIFYLSCKKENQEQNASPPKPNDEKNINNKNLDENPLKNIRGVWLAKTPQGHLESPEKIELVMSNLKQWNFNSIFPVVYTGGYSIYPSKVFQKQSGILQDINPKFRNRDVTKEVFLSATKNGITVIPWFEYGLMVPVYSDLAVKNKSWLTKNSSGGNSKIESGVEMAWLNVLLPDVQKFLIDFFSEFIENYKPKAIQFDDHFGIPKEFLYDPLTLEKYKQSNGLTKIPLNDKDPSWNAFTQWRTTQVTQAVSIIFSSIKKKYPQIKISLAPNPLEFAKRNFLQDWKAWLENGSIDNISLQIYRDQNSAFDNEVNSAVTLISKNFLAIGVLAGISSKVLPVNTLRHQTNTIFEKGLSGVISFSSDAFTDMPATSFNSGETKETRRNFWNEIF